MSLAASDRLLIIDASAGAATPAAAAKKSWIQAAATEGVTATQVSLSDVGV